jgi:hypothetical protein
MIHLGVQIHLGLQLRAPFTLCQFTESVGALVEGCALRSGAERDAPAILRPTGPEGWSEPWSLFAVGLEALALQYLELDPDWPGPIVTT